MAQIDTKKPYDAQRVLLDYFQFDESDLSANRLGEFSEKQKRDLKDTKKDSKKSSIIVGLILIGIGLTILFLLFGIPFLQGSRLDWVDAGNMIPSILIAIAFLGIGIYSLVSGLRTNADVAEHSVRNIEGSVNIVEVSRATYHSPYRRRIIYELRVGTKEFDAYDGLSNVMVQGDVYAVYFDNADDTILSVEWISKG